MTRVKSTLSLAMTQANRIGGAYKAWRRYNAAADNNYHEIAAIFYERMKHLVSVGKFAELKVSMKEVASIDYICSKCGHVATEEEAEHQKFKCPACGAEMTMNR